MNLIKQMNMNVAIHSPLNGGTNSLVAAKRHAIKFRTVKNGKGTCRLCLNVGTIKR